MTSSTERLAAILLKLPSNLQEEVLDYAQYLLDTKVSEGVQMQQPRFYICPTCFAAAKERLECHGHLMIPCNAENLEDCRPITDRDGNLKTRAPRWFVTTVSQSND